MTEIFHPSSPMTPLESGNRSQKVLHLHELRKPYRITAQHPVHSPRDEHEVLVETNAIGLNPIDWKAPDFGFGIPELPYISGRELVGKAIGRSQPAGRPLRSRGRTGHRSRVQLGDRVIAISTDYRDVRKAAYQQYVIANHFNLVRLPPTISDTQGAGLGVASVTSIIALGVCLGLDFSKVAKGPDLWRLVRRIDESRIPQDVLQESTGSIEDLERANQGDWLAIWGGSSTCSFVLNQLARLAGLKTLIVLDTRKHGATLAATPAFQADFVVDSHDPQRAIDIIRSTTGGRLRFGVDCVGKSTASHLQKCLRPSLDIEEGPPAKRQKRQGPTPPGTPPSDIIDNRSHLVGLSGIPKDAPSSIACHTVPVKLFHEVSEIGEAIVTWLEKLLEKQLLVPPRIIGVVDGLEGINEGLDRMRRGEISAGRLVAKIT